MVEEAGTAETTTANEGKATRGRKPFYAGDKIDQNAKAGPVPVQEPQRQKKIRKKRVARKQETVDTLKVEILDRIDRIVELTQVNARVTWE
jgi:hypothetical protein